MTVPPPLVLIAELTHRCPLACAYCSNPTNLVPRARELSTAEWRDVVQQAADLGVVQLHFTGGEPLVRPDLESMVAAAARHSLYATLVTSGLGSASSHPHERLERLVGAGLRAVQVSFQDTDDSAARAISGRAAFRAKRAFALRVAELGASLTVNVVLHRENLERVPELIDLAIELGAERLELAHVQYHGWALVNRARLLPSAEQVARTDAQVREAKQRHLGRMEILYVMPDYFSGRAKPCMGGWGRLAIVIGPDGLALPCHGAAVLPIELESVRNGSLAAIWRSGAAFRAFRGEDWMEDPCRSCELRHTDFGGCRCQALALVGRATATDPACARSPLHSELVALRRAPSAAATRPYVSRRPSSADSSSTERDSDAVR